MKGCRAGACKAPRVSVEDTPGHIIAATDVIREAQTPPSASRKVSSQDPSTVGTSSNSLSGKPTQIEEELNLLSAGMLPPRYKGLVSTSICLALLRFHKSVKRCPQRKLLEWVLLDNIRINNRYPYSPWLSFALTCYA